MKHNIFETVNNLLEQYIGGQIFFTELDRAVKFDKKCLQARTRKHSHHSEW